MWVVIFMFMEAMLGVSLYSYLYLKLAKMLCLSYYLFFNKINVKLWNRICLEVGGRWLKQCIHMTVNVKTIKKRKENFIKTIKTAKEIIKSIQTPGN
jgi:hypothetical protein